MTTSRQVVIVATAEEKLSSKSSATCAVFTPSPIKINSSQFTLRVVADSKTDRPTDSTSSVTEQDGPRGAAKEVVCT